MVSIVQEQGHHLTSVTRVIWLGPQPPAPQSKGPDWNGLLCSVSAILHRQKVGPPVWTPQDGLPPGWAPPRWAPPGWTP